MFHSGKLRPNTRLGWKGLPGTNTLAYHEQFVNYSCKKVYNIVSSQILPYSCANQGLAKPHITLENFVNNLYVQN